MKIINIRIDEKLKNNSSLILARMGLDLSSAIKMFLNQVVVKKGVPFTPTVVDEFGDIGVETLVDFREIDPSGVDAKHVLKSLKNLSKTK